MGAGIFVGRIGGLAIALGVGAAIYGGSAVAWADDSPSSSSTGSESAGAASTGSAGPARTSGRGSAKAASNHSRPTPDATVRTPSSRSTLSAVAESTPASTSESAPALPAAADRVSTLLKTSTPAPAATAPNAPSLLPETPETPVAPVAVTALSVLPGAVLPAAAQNTGVIMGPSGVPIPTAEQVKTIYDLYVVPNSPPGTVPERLVTPEGLYPITGVKSLPLSVSVNEGNQILYDEIVRQIAEGNTATVFGYSQSAIISSLVMNPDNAGCVNTPTCGIELGAPVNFVLVGNEMNPNGGFLSRFPGLDLPSLGIPFYGPTPPDSFTVTNYTLEYDGFADFPRYPLNVISVLNAGLGIIFVHTKYLDVTPEQIENAIALPTSAANQHYYIIPTENLPLLEPLRLIPVIGDPIADLLQPALRVIVNLGYGDPKYGWSNTGYANELTTFGFLPDVDWGEVGQLFLSGVAQGVTDFVADISPGGSMWQDLAAHVSAAAANFTLPDLSPAGIVGAVGGIIDTVQTVITNAANFISNAAASLYAALLPTVDIINATAVVLPAYAADLFLGGIQAALSADSIGGFIAGLIDSVGLPISAAAGLITTSALIEALVVMQAVLGVFTGVVK